MLLRPNGEPFYVGMGSGDRLMVHERRARFERSHKASTIRSIWAQGAEVERVIVDKFDTDLEAKALEIALIASIGRRDLGTGPLTKAAALRRAEEKEISQ